MYRHEVFKFIHLQTSLYMYTFVINSHIYIVCLYLFYRVLYLHTCIFTHSFYLYLSARSMNIEYDIFTYGA